MKQLKFFIGIGITFLMGISTMRAAESLCATVKLEIQQELTLERQAFDARMRINNGFTNLSLDNVNVDVLFMDENENPVLATSDPNNLPATFFIRVDSMDNITDVSGAGVVSPDTSAEIHWLIIPSPGAAGNSPTGALYFVGAELSYRLGGEDKVTEVTPDFITVKPMPEITLDYFLPAQVYGDDPFTPEIEAPVPFPLGVRVRNDGFGPAQNLKIESAQPRIVDNSQGLLVGFEIVNSDVNGVSSPLTLLADFGSIDSSSAGVARWIMTASLSGEFTDFSARMTHADELGGQLTSLIAGVTTHILIKDVVNDSPGRDLVPDFLADDSGLLRLYDSEITDASVVDLSAQASLQSGGASGGETFYSLTLPVTSGFFFIRLNDPMGGNSPLARVVRSDGKVLRSENAWLSRSRQGQNPWEHELNIFDDGGSSAYTVVFGDSSLENQPPVLQFITDKNIMETLPLSFILQASDPEGSSVTITASSLPVGATFVDNGNGTGIFDWTPNQGQAGEYEVVFTASDGILTHQGQAAISVALFSQDLQLTNHPTWITFSTPTWTWNAAPGADGYVYSVDGGTETFITDTSFTASALFDGPHTFTVRAQFGLTNPTFGQLHQDDFGVDMTSPIVWSVALNNGWMGTDFPSVPLDIVHNDDGLGSGVALTEISVDGGPFTSYFGGLVALPGVYGVHRVSVRLVDALGHVSLSVEDDIAYSYAVHLLSGTSPSGDTAFLKDFSRVLSSSVSVEGGAFQFNSVPAGLYGLLVRNGFVSIPYMGRISLREGLAQDVGTLDPGSEFGSVSVQLSPVLGNVPVEAGLRFGRGDFLSLAEGSTAADGSVTLGGLPAGSLWVKARPDPLSGYGETSGHITISTNTTSSVTLVAPAVVPVTGTVNRPDILLMAFGPMGRTSSFLTDNSNQYSVGLGDGFYSIMGHSPFDLLSPVPITVAGAPLTQDLILTPLNPSATAQVDLASLILDDTAEPGIFKSLQLGTILDRSGDSGVPIYVSQSEEISHSVSGAFRIHGSSETSILFLLSDDPVVNIHAANAAPYSVIGQNHYQIIGAGANMAGTVSSFGGGTLPHPFLFLRDVYGNTLGVSEGSPDGTYFFKNVCPDRYALVAIDPETGSTTGLGPITLTEGNPLSGLNLTVGQDNDIHVIHYSTSVIGGDLFPVTVSWNGIDTAGYNLGLKISDDADIWVEQYFEFPSASGVSNFNLNLPGDVPSGEAYVYAFISSKTTGWNGRVGESRTANNMVTVIERPLPLTIDSYPTTAQGGQNTPITVTWNNVDIANYKLFLKIGNPSGTIFVEQSYTLTTSSGTQTFNLNVPQGTPGGPAYVLGFIGHNVTGWEGRVYDTVTANDAVTVLTSALPLILDSYPATAQGGQNTPITVTWNNVDIANYQLFLKIGNPSGTIFVEQSYALTTSSGTQTFNLNVPQGTQAGPAYVLGYIGHNVTGWEGRTYDTVTANDAVTVLTSALPLILDSYPATAQGGQSTPITVTWNNVDISNYQLFLKIGNPSGTIFVEQSYGLATSSGTQTFNLNVPQGTPAGPAYVLGYIGHNVTGWEGRTYDIVTANDAVTVLSSALPLTLDTYPATVNGGEDVLITVTWNNVDTSNYKLFLKISNDGDIFEERAYSLATTDGTNTFPLDMPYGTPGGAAYVLGYIGHNVTGWNGRTYDTRTPGTPITVNHVPVPLTIDSYPTTIVAGNFAPITVTWTGMDTANYRLFLKISNDADIFVEQLYTVSSSNGSGTFYLPVPADTPGGSAYVLVYIGHNVTGWNGRTYDTRTLGTPVTVTAP